MKTILTMAAMSAFVVLTALTVMGVSTANAGPMQFGITKPRAIQKAPANPMMFNKTTPRAAQTPPANPMMFSK